MLLNEMDSLPEGILDLEAHELFGLLQKPTLIHLSGRHSRPLFVSVLVHGNETAGWDAVRGLLAKYDVGGGTLQLPRSLSLFVANVSAAAEGVRHLQGQPDYNRIWPGCGADTEFPAEYEAEYEMTRFILDRMKQLDVFASIDVHNNTGLNPHYACINLIENDFLHLATLFGRTVVYFTDPCRVASKAMARLCPSVTLECGKVGQQHGVDHARDYIEACLHLSEFPQHAVLSHDVDLFHTVATVKIPEDCRFGFSEDESYDLRFSDDIEYMNFRELPAGTCFAFSACETTIPLLVTNERDDIVTSEYFTCQDDQILLRTAVMPSMLTTHVEVIRQDCLCYLMERYQLEG